MYIFRISSQATESYWIIPRRGFYEASQTNRSRRGTRPRALRTSPLWPTGEARKEAHGTADLPGWAARTAGVTRRHCQETVALRSVYRRRPERQQHRAENSDGSGG